MNGENVVPRVESAADAFHRRRAGAGTLPGPTGFVPTDPTPGDGDQPTAGHEDGTPTAEPAGTPH